jgi:hypothetical protein
MVGHPQPGGGGVEEAKEVWEKARGNCTASGRRCALWLFVGLKAADPLKAWRVEDAWRN